MNDNYKWKGTTFNSMGIIIEKTPITNKPKHSYTQYTIPGKSGFLAVDNKTYEPLTLSIECHLNTDNANMNDIREWLDGYGELQIDGEKTYTGYISNAISFEKIMNFRKFIIQFNLQPIAKAIETTTINGYTTAEFESDTYTRAYPVITITGSGTITCSINNIGFTIYEADGTYILDCEAKVITKNGINQSGSMAGEFPYIVNGTNSISKTGTISALTIEYKQNFI